MSWYIVIHQILPTAILTLFVYGIYYLVTSLDAANPCPHTRTHHGVRRVWGGYEDIVICNECGRRFYP